jgi:hypothetical protein
MIARDTFRPAPFDDLATGGAVVVFNGERNILEIVEYYMSFFVHESCGYCTPCRVGNVFLQKAVAKFRKGLANPEDIDYLRDLSATIIETSRCGLGMTSPNPILSTLENFPLVYSAMVKPSEGGIRATFDIQSAIDGARKIAKRRSHIFDRIFRNDGPDLHHHRRGRDRSASGPDDHGGCRRRRDLHPPAVRSRGAAPSGRLPGLHGQGQWSQRRGLHAAGRARPDRRKRDTAYHKAAP